MDVVDTIGLVPTDSAVTPDDILMQDVPIDPVIIIQGRSRAGNDSSAWIRLNDINQEIKIQKESEFKTGTKY